MKTKPMVAVIREMTKKEMKAIGWDEPTIVIELTDGTLLYASRDEEGNGPGCMFFSDPDGRNYILKTQKQHKQDRKEVQNILNIKEK